MCPMHVHILVIERHARIMLTRARPLVLGATGVGWAYWRRGPGAERVVVWAAGFIICWGTRGVSDAEYWLWNRKQM